LLAPVDRLGSVRQNGNGPIAYFPWGEERPGANGTTPDGTDKFATYFRDVTNNGVGEDYANARYYNNNFGRFWSPDPGTPLPGTGTLTRSATRSTSRTREERVSFGRTTKMGT
jgi:hypothetical protein